MKKINSTEIGIKKLLLSNINFDESAASTNPRKRAPQSPINIFALGKLWGRKPKIAPSKINDVSNISLLPNNIEIAQRHSACDEVIPPANPSRPSQRFVALVKNVIQAKLKTMKNIPLLEFFIELNTATASNCPISF